MEILGKRGLGNFLKIMLQIVLVIGILILAVFPLVLKNTNMDINPNIVLFYPNAICLLFIIYQFIGLFDSLKNSNPFCENTVKKLNNAQKICAISSVFWILDFIYEAVFVRMYISFCLVLAFMMILFIGVTIALYILAELFSKALEYKNENDLTI